MPKLFAATIALFLLLGAGYGAIQAARYIPWDCSDWQAFAHEDRTTAILESLAENRGKTLYCGIDQSDTFTKAETWQAGKDRNERDDTVYWGERGSFRGFIAAQEGWLTDGESGITGQSIATIFEFPKKEKKRRRWKTVVVEEREVPADSSREAQSPPGTLYSYSGTENVARLIIRQVYWNDANREAPARADAGFADYWNGKAKAAALAYCRSRGYNRATSVTPGDLPRDIALANSNTQLNEGWGYADFSLNSGYYTGRAYQYVLWSATCQKTKRRRR